MLQRQFDEIKQKLDLLKQAANDKQKDYSREVKSGEAMIEQKIEEIEATERN